MSTEIRGELHENRDEMKLEQYRWQRTNAKHWDQVLDDEGKRIIALEGNHNHHVDTYIAICNEEYRKLAQYEDTIAPLVMGEAECLDHPNYFRPEHKEIKERQVLEHMCASNLKPKLEVYEIHHQRADLPNPYISWTRELPPLSRQQRGKKWLLLNGFELQGTGSRQKWPEGWPWGGLGKEEEILIRPGFHNHESANKVAQAQARAEVKAWEKEEERARLREQEEARLKKEEDLRNSKANRARQIEKEASKLKEREPEVMQKVSEIQAMMEFERQKTAPSSPSQRQPAIASEVVSPKPKRLLGNIANVLGKAVALDRKNSNKMHLAQDRTSIESADSETRQETQEQESQDISEFDTSSQSYTKQSTGVGAKWNLRNAIKNNLTRVGVRHSGERERGGVDASVPPQGLLSTESGDSSATLTPQAPKNTSGLQVPLQSQATRLSAQLNGRSRVNGHGSLHNKVRQAQGQQTSYLSKRQRAQTVVQHASTQNTQPRYSYESNERFSRDFHPQPGKQERSVADQRQAPGPEVYQREDGSF